MYLSIDVVAKKKNLQLNVDKGEVSGERVEEQGVLLRWQDINCINKIKPVGVPVKTYQNGTKFFYPSEFWLDLQNCLFKNYVGNNCVAVSAHVDDKHRI